MFNLLMYDFADWKSGRARILLDRTLKEREYTEKAIVERFCPHGVILFDELSKLPCLFCKEGVKDQPAYVGKIIRANVGGDYVELEVELDANVPPLQNRMIYENRIELKMQEFDFSRYHWAVKDADLYRILLHSLLRRRQRPEVFKLSEHENIDPTLVSVMMPFRRRFNAVYESIRQATNNLELRCERADDIWEDPKIVQDIAGLIDRSRVVICDCTCRNPNVFYEIGISHTLGREVILIAQNKRDISIDLHHLRHLIYRNSAKGRINLTNQLQDKLQKILGY